MEANTMIALLTGMTRDEVARAHEEYEREQQEQAELNARSQPAPFPKPLLHTAHAYSPRENVGSNGGRHLCLNYDMSIGRISRGAGDALCKPYRKFWGLGNEEELDGRKPYGGATCKRCIEIATRGGLL